MQNKTPPSAPELERAVVGAIVMGSVNVDEILGITHPDHFRDAEARRAFLQIIEEHDNDNPIDAAVLSNKTGLSWLNDVSDASSRPEYHADIISEYALRRTIGSEGSKIQGMAYDLSTSIYDTLDFISRLGSTSKSNSDSNVTNAWEVLQNPDEEGDQLKMGIDELDKGLFEYNGFRRGTYTAIYADSGHGKTTSMIMFAGNLIMNGYNVYWSDHEGAKKHVIQPLYEYVQEKLPVPEYIQDVMKRFYITDDTYDIVDIKRTARMLNSNGNLDAVFVDYIQNVDNGIYTQDTDIVKNTSKELNKLKSELDCVVVVGSQVTLKGADRRSGWALFPSDNDWRDSGQIKQDADYILSVFRPSKIEGLLEQDEQTGQVYSKDSNGNRIHKNSVFMRPVKVRGVHKFKQEHLVHNYYGLDFNVG